MTGLHAWGPRGDAARLTAGLLGRPGRAPAPLTASQRQAVRLGAWLHRVNVTRAHLAAQAVRGGRNPSQTASGLRNLQNLAIMDGQRRQLRAMLADTLLGYHETARWML